MHSSKRRGRDATRGTMVVAAFVALASLGGVAIAAPSANAQVDTAAALEVGDAAPGFRAPGATRYGLLRAPVALTDFSDKTVVLAFFYKARTKG